MRFFLLIFLMIFAGCQLSEEDEQKARLSMEEMPDQTSTNVDITYSENAIIKLKLRAPLAIMKEDGGKSINEFPDGLEMTFFDKNGNKNADLYADYGFDDQVTDLRFVKGNVKIKTPDSLIYSTDELYIDEKKDSVHNNGGYALLTKPDGTFVQGYGMISNTRLDFLTIKNTFNSTFPVQENQINKEADQQNQPVQKLELNKEFK